MKKLLSVARSKFYMLKINYPKIFDKLESEVANSEKELVEDEHDPLAARTPFV